MKLLYVFAYNVPRGVLCVKTEISNLNLCKDFVFSRRLKKFPRKQSNCLDVFYDEGKKLEFLSNSIKSGKFPQSWWVERKLFRYIHHQRKLVNNGCQAGLPKTEFLLEPVITSLIRDFLKLQSRKIDFILCTFYLWQVPLLKGKKEKKENDQSLDRSGPARKISLCLFKKRDKLRGKEIGFFKGRTCYLYEKSFNKSIIFTM